MRRGVRDTLDHRAHRPGVDVINEGRYAATREMSCHGRKRIRPNPYIWQGLFAPAGTPAPVIECLHAESAKGLRSADTAERLNAAVTKPVTTLPKAFAAFLQAEIVKWEKVIQQSRTRVD